MSIKAKQGEDADIIRVNAVGKVFVQWHAVAEVLGAALLMPTLSFEKR